MTNIHDDFDEVKRELEFAINWAEESEEIPKSKFFEAMQPFYAAHAYIEEGLELLKKIEKREEI